jgi:hypothetical protein
MLDPRSIAYDVTFTVLFIGLLAAMAVLSMILLAFAAFGVEFGGLQVGAAVLNVVGWMTLPFAPRLYRRLLGHPFSWRANGVLGG